MREIKYIVIHCTATHPQARVDSITTYWRDHLGWSNPGYWVLVDSEGVAHELCPMEQVTNGVRGINSESIHVAYIGGIDTSTNDPKDTRTYAQKATLVEIITQLRGLFPSADIVGHRDVVQPGNTPKACPSFDAKTEYSNI